MVGVKIADNKLTVVSVGCGDARRYDRYIHTLPVIHSPVCHITRQQPSHDINVTVT